MLAWFGSHCPLKEVIPNQYKVVRKLESFSRLIRSLGIELLHRAGGEGINHAMHTIYLALKHGKIIAEENPLEASTAHTKC